MVSGETLHPPSGCRCITRIASETFLGDQGFQPKTYHLDAQHAVSSKGKLACQDNYFRERSHIPPMEKETHLPNEIQRHLSSQTSIIIPVTIMNLMSTSYVSSDPNSAYLLYKYIEAMMIPTCMDIVITMDHSGFHGSCQGFKVAVAHVFTLPNVTSTCSNKKYIFIHRVHFPVFPS